MGISVHLHILRVINVCRYAHRLAALQAALQATGGKEADERA